MDDDQIFYPHLKKIGYPFHRFSAQVHESHRFGKNHFLRINPTQSVTGFETSRADLDMVDSGESIHDLESNIVSTPLIEDSRISQSDDELHARLFFLLLLLLLHLRLLFCLCFWCNGLFHYFLFFRHGWDHCDNGEGSIR